jgi:hypothetical protein
MKLLTIISTVQNYMKSRYKFVLLPKLLIDGYFFDSENKKYGEQ